MLHTIQKASDVLALYDQNHIVASMQDLQKQANEQRQGIFLAEEWGNFKIMPGEQLN